MKLGVKAKRWLVFVLVVVTILFLCWQDSKESAELTLSACNKIVSLLSKIGLNVNLTNSFYLIVRKTGHFIIFMVLAASSCLAIGPYFENPYVAFLLPIFIDFAIAAIAEYSQVFFAGRIVSHLDLLVNIIGVIVGAATTICVINNATEIHQP